MPGPSLFATATALVLALAIGGFANLQLRRPFHERVWQHIPWFGVQFVAATIFLILAAHLVSILTGHDFRGRYGS
jgi:hypothetical protein